jgi:hypothetical protein
MMTGNGNNLKADVDVTEEQKTQIESKLAS